MELYLVYCYCGFWVLFETVCSFTAALICFFHDALHGLDPSSKGSVGAMEDGHGWVNCS